MKVVYITYIFQEATVRELEHLLCDNFDIRLSDMQILIADKGNPVLISTD